MRNGLVKYGEVKEITHEIWSTAYRYPVANGVRVAQIMLKTHIPSNLMIAGQRVLIYEGQPLTCYGCGQTNHLYSACPNRRQQGGRGRNTNDRSWADIAAGEQSKADLDPAIDSNKREIDTNQDGTGTNPAQQGGNLGPLQVHNMMGDNMEDRAETEQHTVTSQQVVGQVGENKQNSSIESVDKGDTMDTDTQRTRPRTQELDGITEAKQMQPSLQDDTTPEGKGQRMRRGSRKDSISWAEEMDDIPDVDVQSNPTCIQNPKQIKKLKLERYEAKPHEKSRSRTQKSNKQS